MIDLSDRTQSYHTVSNIANTHNSQNNHNFNGQQMLCLAMLPLPCCQLNSQRRNFGDRPPTAISVPRGSPGTSGWFSGGGSPATISSSQCLQGSTSWIQHGSVSTWPTGQWLDPDPLCSPWAERRQVVAIHHEELVMVQRCRGELPPLHVNFTSDARFDA